jgi:hypothetical protein
MNKNDYEQALINKHNTISNVIKIIATLSNQKPVLERDLLMTDWALKTIKQTPDDLTSIYSGYLYDTILIESKYIEDNYKPILAVNPNLIYPSSSSTSSFSEIYTAICNANNNTLADWSKTQLIEYDKIKEEDYLKEEISKYLLSFTNKELPGLFTDINNSILSAITDYTLLTGISFNIRTLMEKIRGELKEKRHNKKIDPAKNKIFEHLASEVCIPNSSEYNLIMLHSTNFNNIHTDLTNFGKINTGTTYDKLYILYIKFLYNIEALLNFFKLKNIFEQ